MGTPGKKQLWRLAVELQNGNAVHITAVGGGWQLS
jgi:hypothetical protein